jgi:pyruvate/2-oxoacid:ferredoxin oxidoreductase beta subunit/Pyruvate/2-oxoacid:ferredoxin oxidoreductase gamma subunit
LVDNAVFPYCSGCGHTWINKSLDSALQKLGKKPTKINLVSDIGCVGLVDKLFLTNTIHTTHGRSTAFASGLQLADEILYDGDTVHVVMIGDGGATIGLLHLIEAAKLNVKLTVILHNNFVYGMTGGQNSGLTPENFRTATTMQGNITPALHIADLLKSAQAGFIARKLATDKDLDDTIMEAMQYPGFALVEVIELCTGYATKWNKMSKNDVQEILERMDCGEMGTLVKRSDRKTYGANYHDHFPLAQKPLKQKLIETKSSSRSQKSFSVVVAGSAGEGVQFASRILAEAALREGFNIVQKNDNPVTIGTGFSISELNFSPDTIYYSGIDIPDYMLISSIDGFNKAKDFLMNLSNPDLRKSENKNSTKTKIIIDKSLLEALEAMRIDPQYLEISSLDFRGSAKDKRSVNLMMLGYLVKYSSILNPASLIEAAKSSGKNTESIIQSLS